VSAELDDALLQLKRDLVRMVAESKGRTLPSGFLREMTLDQPYPVVASLPRVRARPRIKLRRKTRPTMPKRPRHTSQETKPTGRESRTLPAEGPREPDGDPEARPRQPVLPAEGPPDVPTEVTGETPSRSMGGRMLWVAVAVAVAVAAVTAFVVLYFLTAG
jgi:hypothetical protein